MILGALLHDVGTLIGKERGARTLFSNGIDIGPEDHDLHGEEYLKERGFPEEIYRFARGHVKAMQYNCYKENMYKKSKLKSFR